MQKIERVVPDLICWERRHWQYVLGNRYWVSSRHDNLCFK